MSVLKFSIILLAAGASSRMGGEHKLLLPWGTETVVGASARVAAAVADAHLVVVLGCRADEVRNAAFTDGAVYVVNPRWQEGMYTSIQTGLAHLPKNVEAFFVALGDMPLVPVRAYTDLMAAYRPGCICVPTFEGRRGHPVLVPRALVGTEPPPEGDQGLRSVLRRHPELVVEVPLPYAGICIDLDTPAEYERHQPR
ncbi:MAG TPA: nucleotidyltransferase family protein [Symbiobacteriaceae bacterium]|nr:nucleotidyltransferase family protein [Symbiobacteriaceae bacterium]